MKERDYTSERLAEESGIAKKMIEKYIAEETTPSLVVAGILSEHLDIPINHLVYVHPDQVVEAHCIETSSIKEAIKLQNYFETNDIDVEVTVFVNDSDEEVFLVEYISEHVYTIKEIKKIVSRFRWLDGRYLFDDLKDRYRRMTVSSK